MTPPSDWTKRVQDAAEKYAIEEREWDFHFGEVPLAKEQEQAYKAGANFALELLKQSKTQLESEIGLLKESRRHTHAVELQAALATCQKQLDFAEREAKYLWGLLDDIDTAGDQFKPEHNGYFKAICKLVADRFTNLKSDGYSLKWADHTPLADMRAVGKK